MGRKRRSCGLCEPTATTLAPAGGRWWRVVINRNQSLLGKTMIVLRRHEEDVTALTEEEWAALREEVASVTQRLRHVFAPDHFNYAFLQNADRHVHVHVIPRYERPRRFAGLAFSDPDYPGPYAPTHEPCRPARARRARGGAEMTPGSRASVFGHVIWIGGATGSGKTTLARLLAARHALRRYHLDDYWYAHTAALGERTLAPDEQWLGLTAVDQAEEFHTSSARRFALALRDLEALPHEPPIVVEGPQVLPELLPPGSHAVFLLPTAEFQRAVLRRRPLPPTAEPDRALRNRIEKDRLFGQRVEAAARRRGFGVIRVDGSRSPDDILAEASRHLSEAPALAPRTLSGADFSSVRRWENDALAANVRSWLGSADVIDGPLPPWSFACECGEPSCGALVPLTLEEFDGATTIRSAGH